MIVTVVQLYWAGLPPRETLQVLPGKLTRARAIEAVVEKINRDERVLHPDFIEPVDEIDEDELEENCTRIQVTVHNVRPLPAKDFFVVAGSEDGMQWATEHRDHFVIEWATSSKDATRWTFEEARKIATTTSAKVAGWRREFPNGTSPYFNVRVWRHGDALSKVQP